MNLVENLKKFLTQNRNMSQPVNHPKVFVRIVGGDRNGKEIIID